MQDPEIRARINELRAEIQAEIEPRLREIDRLLELLDGDGRNPPRRLRIVGGGTAAMAAALGTAVRLPLRRPRHPVGVAAAAATLGALTVLFAVPAHTTPGGTGYSISQPSIPVIPPPSFGSPMPQLSPTGSVRTPGTQASRTSGGGAARAPTSTPAAPGPSASIPAARPPSPTQPSPTVSAPSPTPTGIASCQIRLGVSPILDTCVNL